MKSYWKNSFNIGLMMGTLLLGAACGKKENKVNIPATSSTSPYYVGNSAVSATIVNQVNSIKANVACYNGYRLANDISFYVNTSNGSSSRTTIGGQFIQGYLTTGSAAQLYVGVSTFRDLMFVTKVTNGSQVLGYNVTLSFCEMKSAYQNFPSIISNETSLTNFLAPSGIVLDSDTHCGYGVVDWAPNTYITATRTVNNPYATGPVQVPTSFTKPTCNGQF